MKIILSRDKNPMKFLQITTYDVERPDHGGKLRSYHIRKSLRNKYEVETLSFEWRDVEDCSSLRVLLDLSRCEALGVNGLIVDWGICTYLDYFPKTFASIAESVRRFAPDVLLLEQPFLWPVVQNLISQGVVSPSVKVIYSSQNIEVKMKRKIYRNAFSEEIAQRYTAYVDTIEKGVINACMGALAVSTTDAEYIRKLVPSTPVKVYLNGHTRPIPTNGISIWHKRFAPRQRNWVFVGSGHPPNINGLRQLVEAIPMEISSESFALWVLGSVGNGLQASIGAYAERYPWLHLLGPVEPQDIDEAILQSSGVVLPIWEGGGSNLKTAQALLSEKCILGSEFSFRGFESYMDEEGVYLSEDAQGLARLLLETMPANLYARSSAVKQLEWDSVLESLPEYLAEILNRGKMENA